MHDDLDQMFARLSEQPLPLRLNGLEAGVSRSLREQSAPAAASWRYAAIGIALVAGVGVGGSGTALQQAPALAADLSGGIGLAPSSLLDVST